jgi:eukaryotic-like serine/threonine-protein kinase
VVADGGMGRVYEALDVDSDSRVAIKVLHPEVARDEVAVERFKREFEVSKLLPHAHIVEVKDFSETEDHSYALVMEFLDGEELRMVLKRDKFVRPERLIRMLSQVAIGLDEAHRRQLVHRDLKPDNLFLCGTHEGDLAKVLDFGSVKDKSSMAKKLTVVGTTIGSPFYMAPEQAQGLDTLDARADVWGLAAICYECATGRVPFQGANGPSIIFAIMTKDPDPPTHVGIGAPVAIPPALDVVMEVALAKNPAIRTRSVGALADDVGRAYGLGGDHKEWAYVPKSSLKERIERELPRLLASGRAAPRVLLPIGDPFAPQRGTDASAVMQMSDPFAPVALADPFASARAADGCASVGGSLLADQTSSSTADSPPDGHSTFGIPRSPPKWIVPMLIGTVALALGLIGTFFFLR